MSTIYTVHVSHLLHLTSSSRTIMVMVLWYINIDTACSVRKGYCICIICYVYHEHRLLFLIGFSVGKKTGYWTDEKNWWKCPNTYSSNCLQLIYIWNISNIWRTETVHMDTLILARFGITCYGLHLESCANKGTFKVISV